MLVRIIKNWTSPDLMRQTPCNSGVWKGIRFTCDAVSECDAIVVLNVVPEQTSVRCAPENVWAIMQEPYIEDVFDWMLEGHGQYARVFTHYPPRRDRLGKYKRSHPALPWHIDKSYDELKAQQVPDKPRDLSWITSNMAIFPGHKGRMRFLDHLRSREVRLDLYGKGINYIEDKWNGLAPYRYSLAIENSSGPDYWTEKVADCFLSWTIPIYFGCTNLEDYFPAESFIRIDINQPDDALKVIDSVLSSDDWNARLPALEEARNLVLDKYQLFPQVHEFLQRYHRDVPPRSLSLIPFRKQYHLIRRIRRRLLRLAGIKK